MVDPDALSLILSQQAAIQTDVSAMRADLQKAMIRLELLDEWRLRADATDKDFEARLRLLERFRWSVAGLAASLGCGGGFLAWFLTHVTR